MTHNAESDARASIPPVDRAISELEYRRSFEQVPANADTPMKIEIAEEEIDNRAEYVLLEAYKDLQSQLATKDASHKAELQRLQAKVRELTTQLDHQLGTPCEQIRHAAELEALRERAAKVADAERAEMRRWAKRHHDEGNVHAEDICVMRRRTAMSIAADIRALPLTEKEAG